MKTKALILCLIATMCCVTAHAVTFPSSAYKGGDVAADASTDQTVISAEGAVVVGEYKYSSLGGSCSGSTPDECTECCITILENCDGGLTEECMREYQVCVNECFNGPSLPLDCGLGFALSVLIGYALINQKKKENQKA